MSWSKRFDDPIVLPGGIRLTTPKEAIAHLVKTVPKAERNAPTVLNAAEIITLAAERVVPMDFARIATLRAINRNVARVFNPDRKDPHWGRRKLKREE